MYLNGLKIDEKFDISMDSPKKMKYQKFLAQKLSEYAETDLIYRDSTK